MKSETINTWIRLFKKINKDTRVELLIIGFLIIISAIFECFSIASILPLIKVINNPDLISFDNISYINNLSNRNIIILLGVVFGLLSIISGYLRSYTLYKSYKISSKIGINWSKKIYEILLKSGYEKLILLNSSKYLNLLITELNQTIAVIKLTFVFLANSFIGLFIILSLLIYNTLPVICLLIIFAILYGLLMRFNKKRLIDLSKRYINYSNFQIKSIQETFGSLRELKLSNNEDNIIQKYIKNDAKLRYTEADSSFIKSYPRIVIEASILVLSSLTLVFYKVFLNKDLDFAYLTMLALGIQKTLPTIQNAYLSWSSLKNYSESVNDILKILHTDVEEEITNISPFRFENFIQLQNVSYNYHNNPLVLKDINLKIKKGEKIGITGKTGAGKSTIVDLITGLLTPKTGGLIIDNKVINKYKDITAWKSWLNSISYVSQNFYLSDTTIKENIAYGIDKNKIDIKKIKEVSKIAECEEFISKLPHSYETLVGERGSTLSGGQRQRIAIARALYRLNSILILDEASSALDKITEDLIINNISNSASNLTLIIISHQQRMLDFCDKIYMFEQNKLVLKN